MYRMTGAGRCVESLTRVVWRNKSAWWLFGPSIYIFFVGSQTAIFVPRGKRSDWIFINVFFFFLLIYRKRKFCAEPMGERLTFHFELRTGSVNFRFFFFSSFLSFCFFQIKARSRLVTRRKRWSIRSSLKEIVNFVFNKFTQETWRTRLSRLILHKETPRRINP